MPPSTMRHAVLQATTLLVVAAIIDYHMSENMFDQVKNDEGWRNMLHAVNVSAPYFRSTPDAPSGRLTLGAGNSTNTSVAISYTSDLQNKNSADVKFGETSKESELFYSRTLLRKAVIYLVTCVLEYYWLIWLERMFPARPRLKATSYLREEKVEENEDREEEVVKRWIAQGRVHRASLNWCNTFLKWILELTVGNVMCIIMVHVLTALLKFQSPKTVLEGLKTHVMYQLIGTYMTPTPLVTLVAFVVIPAHRQIVFFAGADLVMTIFISTLFRAFASWAIKTDLVQSAMRNITEHARKMENEEYRAKFQKLNELKREL